MLPQGKPRSKLNIYLFQGVLFHYLELEAEFKIFLLAVLIIIITRETAQEAN